MMGQGRQLRKLSAAILLALPFFLTGCKLEETLLPTGTTASDAVTGEGAVGISSTGSSDMTAPIIADPLPGSTVAGPRPTLTVLNSARAGGEPATYLFQVSSEADFVTLEAQSPQVTEGPNGSTAWTTDRDLGPGRHFWRARARSGTAESAFSAAAELTIGSETASGPPPSAPAPPPPTAGTIISDPLAGGSIGEVTGGRFTAGGWQVLSPGNFIRYEVPPMVRGWVEFETRGLREVNPSPDQFMLFGMWDPTAGPFRANPFRVNLQKLHPNPHNPPYLRVRWISNGEQHDAGSNFFAWDPEQTYQWRIEWGPSGSGNAARVFLDGQQIVSIAYSRAYRPNVHFIELGIGERGESIVGVTYSNLQIGN